MDRSNGGQTLYHKVWEAHKIRKLADGSHQMLIGRHLMHEVTSPQAFHMLKELKLRVAYPNLTFATVDHIIPTNDNSRPLKDPLAEEMLQAIEQNTKEHKIEFAGADSDMRGIIHCIGPELGLTHPGSMIACGDSHTSTHGAFGAVAFGIGTGQVRDVLATQTVALEPLKVRRVVINGQLLVGVAAKDVILHIIRILGVNGGTGYAYEYAGTVIENMSMEERMTICNMSIEGGARCGYINPDETTFNYLKGRKYSPAAEKWSEAVEHWQSYCSDANAQYDDQVVIDGTKIAPTLTWGINPQQAISIDESIPVAQSEVDRDALEYMNFQAGAPLKGQAVDVCFIGSCTNGRLSDFLSVAEMIKGRKVANGVRALAVPGSARVAKEARELGIDNIFIQAGFEWRDPGCSMCLAMNPDKLKARELCASSSNRNFKGRQGHPTGRTILMGPLMVAASAINGKISDPREVFNL